VTRRSAASPPPSPDGAGRFRGAPRTGGALTTARKCAGHRPSSSGDLGRGAGQRRSRIIRRSAVRVDGHRDQRLPARPCRASPSTRKRTDPGRPWGLAAAPDLGLRDRLPVLRRRCSARSIRRAAVRSPLEPDRTWAPTAGSATRRRRSRCRTRLRRLSCSLPITPEARD